MARNPDNLIPEEEHNYAEDVANVPSNLREPVQEKLKQEREEKETLEESLKAVENSNPDIINRLEAAFEEQENKKKEAVRKAKETKMRNEEIAKQKIAKEEAVAVLKNMEPNFANRMTDVEDKPAMRTGRKNPLHPRFRKTDGEETELKIEPKQEKVFVANKTEVAPAEDLPKVETKKAPVAEAEQEVQEKEIEIKEPAIETKVNEEIRIDPIIENRIKRNLNNQIEQLIAEAQSKAENKKAADYEKMKQEMGQMSTVDAAYTMMSELNRLGDEVESQFKKKAGSLSGVELEKARAYANMKIKDYWTGGIELAEKLTGRNFQKEAEKLYPKITKEEYASEAAVEKRLSEVAKDVTEDKFDELLKKYGVEVEDPEVKHFLIGGKHKVYKKDGQIVGDIKMDWRGRYKKEDYLNVLRSEIKKELLGEFRSNEKEMNRYRVHEFVFVLEHKKLTEQDLSAGNSKDSIGLEVVDSSVKKQKSELGGKQLNERIKANGLEDVPANTIEKKEKKRNIVGDIGTISAIFKE